MNGHCQKADRNYKHGLVAYKQSLNRLLKRIKKADELQQRLTGTEVQYPVESDQ